MSNTANSLTALGRRTLIVLVVADVALFVLANLTANNSSHPGSASNAFFVAFVIGAVLLITVAVATVIESRRGTSR
jgi:fucose 4-O-acetylase-like acetyltransferase